MSQQVKGIEFRCTKPGLEECRYRGWHCEPICCHCRKPVRRVRLVRSMRTFRLLNLRAKHMEGGRHETLVIPLRRVQDSKRPLRVLPGRHPSVPVRAEPYLPTADRMAPRLFSVIGSKRCGRYLALYLATWTEKIAKTRSMPSHCPQGPAQRSLTPPNHQRTDSEHHDRNKSNCEA